MDGSQSKNELLGFTLASLTALFWTTGSIGVQGLNQTIPHFELNIMRLSGNFYPHHSIAHSNMDFSTGIRMIYTF